MPVASGRYPKRLEEAMVRIGIVSRATFSSTAPSASTGDRVEIVLQHLNDTTARFRLVTG